MILWESGGSLACGHIHHFRSNICQRTTSYHFDKIESKHFPFLKLIQNKRVCWYFESYLSNKVEKGFAPKTGVCPTVHLCGNRLIVMLMGGEGGRR